MWPQFRSMLSSQNGILGSSLVTVGTGAVTNDTDLPSVAP